MKINLHKSVSRGVANHGWLNSYHTYSFSSYQNPERMGFGKLRVINDDVVDASMGFGTHPHDNMEIISIPLRGSLRHEDSMGNRHIIEAGEIQVMSAGTGITHSEYNNSEVDQVNFLQIWILPKKIDIKPRYEQRRFECGNRKNKFQLVVSPDGEGESTAINQDVYFSMIDLDKERAASYQLHKSDNGVYVFVISGAVMISGQRLDARDGVEISDSASVDFIASTDAQLLCIETPL